jgi:para-nitrobenzyl esterase
MDIVEKTGTVAQTALGTIEGVWKNGVALFRGVPFAAPPIGSRRFAAPEPVEPWSGVRNARDPAPIAPQMPARLRLVMGDFTRPASEDSLTLTIATPAADRKRRPVLVWLHGGAFMTGAGSLDWYDGTRFAQAHDTVVVGVNYRLGPLGWLKLDGVSPGNLGLRDQIAALEWVGQHIAAFGGDPESVTVAGQSAGGISVFALMANGNARRLFRRAIIQSGPLHLLPSAAEAEQTGARYLEAAGVEPSALRQLPPAALLEAQMKLLRAGARFGDASPPFLPIRDGELIPHDPWAAAVGAAREIDVVIGWTRDEMSAFFAPDPEVNSASMEKVEAAIGNAAGPGADELLALSRRRRPGATPAALLDMAITDLTFVGPTIAFAERLAESGRPAWLYRFDWSAPGNKAGACHCIELPFMFANFESWDAPMLAGGDSQEMAAIANVMQKAWASFVRNGDPNHDALPTWPPYAPERRATLRFDRIIDVAGDLAGHCLRRAWPHEQMRHA